MDKRGQRRDLSTRRSSRRLQVTSSKGYRDNGSDSEDCVAFKSSSHQGRGHDIPNRSNTGSRQQGVGKTSGTFSSSSSHHKFKWSLQSELMTKQLGKLFWDGDRDKDLTTGGCSLATDVTLVSSEGDCVEAHKVILILCSPYFRRLFAKLTRSLKKNCSASSNNTVLVMGNVGTACLKNLICFIYTGEVNVASNEQSEFLKMGEFLGISGIRSVDSKSGDGNESQEVIKVHVIDKRYAEGTAGSSADENAGPSRKLRSSHDAAPTVSCKQEPVDDGVGDYEDLDFENSMQDDHGDGSDYSDDNDDDRCSNFSDEIRQDANMDGRGRKSSDSSNNAKPCRAGYEPRILRGVWREMDPVTDEDLKDNWRVVTRKAGLDNYESCVYYCYHGARRCPTRIKRIIEDGDVTWYTNQEKHAGHREMHFGLPLETKRFVVSMMEQGIRKPQKIFKAMRLLSMDLPTKTQLANFITYTVRKGEQEFPFSKKVGPRRIRKYKPKETDGPPRKRGRPRVNPPTTKMNLGRCYPDKKAQSQQSQESATGSSTETSKLATSSNADQVAKPNIYSSVVQDNHPNAITSSDNDGDGGRGERGLCQESSPEIKRDEPIPHQFPHSGFTSRGNIIPPQYSFGHGNAPPPNYPFNNF